MTQPKPANQNPQPQKAESKPNIQGEPLPLDELLDIAKVDSTDAESASTWWDENASEDWIGALDSKPIKGDKKP